MRLVGWQVTFVYCRNDRHSVYHQEITFGPKCPHLFSVIVLAILWPLPSPFYCSKNPICVTIVNGEGAKDKHKFYSIRFHFKSIFAKSYRVRQYDRGQTMRQWSTRMKKSGTFCRSSRESIKSTFYSN